MLTAVWFIDPEAAGDPPPGDTPAPTPPAPNSSDEMGNYATGTTPEQRKALEQQAYWGGRLLGPLAADASPYGTIGWPAGTFGSDFAETHGGNPDSQEAARHAYWQAWLLIRYGADNATEIGHIHETYGSNRDLYDSARDQWNNKVGRRIAQQVLDEGYWWTSTRDERVKELIGQAWDHGEFIDKPHDSRITPELMGQERLRQEQHKKDNEVRLEREVNSGAPILF